jgi:hypothetical protein
MNDVRLVMEHAARAVSAEIAHHAHALRLDKTLNGVVSPVAPGFTEACRAAIAS